MIMTMMPMRRARRRPAARGALLLTLALLAGGLAGCTPPQARVRVDIAMREGGRCVVEDERVGCDRAGTVAVAHHPGQAISAVVLVDPQVAHASRATLIESLRQARVDHVQFGDPALLQYQAPPRLRVEP